MQIERLTQWGVIEVTGEDAAGFLQGQLTQDVKGLSPQQATLAAYCTAKGRMLGQFVVIRDASRFLLLTHADLADAQVKRLNMFVLRLKCKLRNASADMAVLGLKGSLSAAGDLAVLGEAAVRGLISAGGGSGMLKPFERSVPQLSGETAADGVIALLGWPAVDANARHLLVVDAAIHATALSSLFAQSASASSADAGRFWQSDDVLCGLPFLEPANLEAFVPQMLNLDVVGGVSFTKGCYPGQEVVARSHYLGKMKRRMHIGSSSEASAAGVDIFSTAHPGEAAGRVVNAAPAAQGGWVLSFEIATDDALADARLTVGSPDGPALTLLPLPYSLPAPQTPPGR